MKRYDSIHISTYDRPTMVDVNDYKGQFEPTTNKHQWSRWRMAVNDKLCGQNTLVMTNQSAYRIKSAVSVADVSALRRFPKFLSEAPYREHVKMTDDTIRNANKMMITGGGKPDGDLETGQFIYFGIPRICLMKGKATTSGEDTKLLDVFIPKGTALKRERKRKVVRF